MMNYKTPLLQLAITMLLIFNGCTQNTKTSITNPIMPGYFADPSILKYEGAYYMYATIDPWGGEELAVFKTTDFTSFEREHLNWPTKAQCTSSTSRSAMVWAPSVVQAKNGKFYMHVSVGSEIWVGVADHPLGPWNNAKEDGQPLIHGNYFEDYHMIDAQCFIDEDGTAYLYWGSGWDWVNGKCFAVKLEDNMVDFASTPKDVTPPNFFEAPFMLKRNEKYYLMYSNGKAIDHTYHIRYAVGDTPFGPFTEAQNSPLLETTPDSTTYGPGHHSVFTENNQDYILYHRIYPQTKDYVLRQLCLDSLNWDANGNIKKIHPNAGVVFSN